ncbi:MAG: DUF1697 domain-containing protein [Deltaproteobacteria bacterium]|nr:DUF1697 domain-containing protein [Deltaproteobacteria bacterium]
MTGKHVSTWVVLLRGINVGGRNKVPMAALRGLLEALGCGEVRTYIQSGNTVLTATKTLAARLPEALAEAMAERFGFRVSVLLRAGRDLERVATTNPFLATGADPRQLHVAFLAEVPEASAVATLDPDRSPPDRFIVRGPEVFLHLPNGVGRTKLTNAYLDRTLGTTSTVRNWRTVLALAELARG